DASRSHAERLPAEIVALASAHDVALADVDLFAVAAGPGSFTGLRIGIATVQGLASIRQRPVFGMSTLDALAYAVDSSLPVGAAVGAWMDAQRRDVFAAASRVAAEPPYAAGRVRLVDGPLVDTPSAILERWTATPGVAPHMFVGDGAVLYEEVIKRALVGAR